MGSGFSALKNGRRIVTHVVIRSRDHGYAKSLIGTSALAAILVLAAIGMAFADDSTPENLVSSELTRDDSYVTWDDAVTQIDEAEVAAQDTTSVHGDYATSTVTCEVCHSGHTASATGDSLLLEASENSCEPCHLGASAISRLKVSEGNGHGESGQCTNGYCHTPSPHGYVGVSKYATLKTAMLTDHADSLLDAAIASRLLDAPVQGNIFAADTDSVIATISVYNHCQRRRMPQVPPQLHARHRRRYLIALECPMASVAHASRHASRARPSPALSRRAAPVVEFLPTSASPNEHHAGGLL